MKQKTLKNNRFNKYEKGKRTNVESFKSYLLVKELLKQMENITIFIEMINFDNKFFNIYKYISILLLFTRFPTFMFPIFWEKPVRSFRFRICLCFRATLSFFYVTFYKYSP